MPPKISTRFFRPKFRSKKITIFFFVLREKYTIKNNFYRREFMRANYGFLPGREKPGRIHSRPKNLYTTLQFDPKVWTKSI